MSRPAVPPRGKAVLQANPVAKALRSPHLAQRIKPAKRGKGAYRRNEIKRVARDVT